MPPTPGPISINSVGPQGFSPVSVLLLPSYLIMFLLSPPGRSALPPRSLLFLSPVIAFFSLPSGTEASSLGPFSLLTFLSSVDYILNIFCPFFGSFPFISAYIPGCIVFQSEERVVDRFNKIKAGQYAYHKRFTLDLGIQDACIEKKKKPTIKVLL